MATTPTMVFQLAVNVTSATIPTAIHMSPVITGITGCGGRRPTCERVRGAG